MLRKLCNMDVPPVGLGCMGMSEFYGATDDAQSMDTLLASYELGFRHYDTADMYGRGHNEELLGRFLGKLGPERGNVVVATKVGIVRDQKEQFSISVNSSPDYIKKSCDSSLSRLGVDCIDLYYLHRIDPEVGLEESVGAMKDLMDAGKIRGVGLCEVTADTLRKANSICPISALQSEYSLWTRDIEESVLPACRDLDIPIVAFSPLGRGFLTGTVDETTLENEEHKSDLRTRLPRFSKENIGANLELVSRLSSISERLGISNPQLALVWLLSRYENIHVIPGTKRIKYLRENFAAKDYELSAEDLDAVTAIFSPDSVQGERYPKAILSKSNK